MTSDQLSLHLHLVLKAESSSPFCPHYDPIYTSEYLSTNREYPRWRLSDAAVKALHFSFAAELQRLVD